MLDIEHAIGEHLGGIAIQHRHTALGNDRAVVEHRRDEMHGAAMGAHPCGNRLRMGVQTRKSRQQRRMNVDHAPGIPLDESRREHAHEACKQHIIGLVTVHFLRQRSVERVAAGELPMIKRRRGNTLRPRPIQPRRVKTAGDDGGDRGRPALFAAGLGHALHVAAPPRNQDDEAARR